MLEKLSFSQKISILVVSATLIGAVGLYFVIALHGFEETSAAIVDAAGRNRMLSQRIAFYSHIIVHGTVEAVNIDEAKNILNESVYLHNTTLHALRYGGIALGIANDTVLPPAPSHLLPLFSKAEELWNEYHDNALIILTAPASINGTPNPRAEAAMEYIEEDASEMLKRDNEIVAAYVEYLHGMGENMRKVLIALFAGFLLVSGIVYLFSQSITREMERAEQKLSKAYEELKSLDELKERFVQDTAHELKTPLAVILAALDPLKKKGMRIDKKRFKSLIDVMSRNGERLRDTIEKTLEVYKISQGKKEYSREQFDLKEVIDKTVSNYAAPAAEKGLKLVNKTGKLPAIIGDPRAFRTVMENLVDNAVKNTEKGSVTVNGKVEKGNIVVSVKDTGIGIPLDAQKHIFERFFRVRAESPGSGVGLVVTKHIIEAHGGRIWFESEPGKGTVFTFTIPVKETGRNENKKSE